MISRPITAPLHVAALRDGMTEISVEAHITDRVRGIAVLLTGDEVRGLIADLAATLPEGASCEIEATANAVASKLRAVGRVESEQPEEGIVARALHEYGGPCSQAYADVVSAYVCATHGQRDALFLAVAFEAAGRERAPDAGPAMPTTTDRAGSAATSARALHREIDLALARKEAVLQEQLRAVIATRSQCVS
ncbi:hypothetical protein [Methylobacterium nonmethylotrophicum]|uniref:Uncharacterized protein n=1 Tax=Methylobacterium nonmethylotrophicum TaxID=1141884 RepID=A0A4Z0NPN3_9HYPH|nr:hypothetical protein [Methylobacterium nonmethylotrophicum]TGD98081.1 hypothetical protein EU555_18210 [Methylobacterium nonmethylotrophicum]